MSLPSTPSFRLDGRRALVTGASRGIGLGCAMALAEAGAEVVGAARGLDGLDAAMKDIAGAGHKARAVALDISDLDSIRTVLKEQGPFDVVVNSAGVARHGPSLDTTPEDFDLVIAANLRGAYFLAQQAAKQMIAAGKPGSIIQISSQMGHVGGMERAVYCGTKHGIEGFNKAMAIEWGPHGIRTNSICPTFVKTEFTAKTFADPEKRAWIESKIKLGRVAEVEDIMGACLFLACDASAMVTGTSILVDGGWTAG